MTGRWHDAVHAAPEGCEVDVEVQPGASCDRFPDGYNAWRKRIKVRLSAPAQDGRANAALTSIIAEFLQVPARDVELLRGATDRQKRILVRGVTADQATARLKGALDGSR